MKVIVTRQQAVMATSPQVRYMVGSEEVPDYFEDVDGWVIAPGGVLSIVDARGAVYSYAGGNWSTVRRGDE